jgi:hypothetical protein
MLAVSDQHMQTSLANASIHLPQGTAMKRLHVRRQIPRCEAFFETSFVTNSNKSVHRASSLQQ